MGTIVADTGYTDSMDCIYSASIVLQVRMFLPPYSPVKVGFEIEPAL